MFLLDLSIVINYNKDIDQPEKTTGRVFQKAENHEEEMKNVKHACKAADPHI